MRPQLAPTGPNSSTIIWQYVFVRTSSSYPALGGNGACVLVRVCATGFTHCPGKPGTSSLQRRDTSSVGRGGDGLPLTRKTRVVYGASTFYWDELVRHIQHEWGLSATMRLASLVSTGPIFRNLMKSKAKGASGFSSRHSGYVIGQQGFRRTQDSRPEVYHRYLLSA